MATMAAITAGGTAAMAGIITAAGSGITTIIITVVTAATITDRLVPGLRRLVEKSEPAYPAIRSRIAGLGSGGVGAMR